MALRRRPVSRRSPKSLRISLRRVLLGVFAVAALALSAAAPAGAVNATLGGNNFGFEPRDAAAPFSQGNLVYHGGPVMHSNNTYAIYWDPPTPSALTGNYDGDWKSLINGFLSNVAADSGDLSNVYALTGQYADAGGGHAAYKSTFRGAYTDTQTYPTPSCTVGVSTGGVCVTDAQIRGELTRFIGANSLPQGMDKLYFLLTPPGVTVCTDSSGTDCSARSTPTSFCSYHSFIGDPSTPGPSTLIYAVQPWTAGAAGLGTSWENLGSPSSVLATDCQDSTVYPNGPVQEEPNQMGLDTDGDYDAGLADLIINEVSVEQMDAITNPLLNAWYEDSTKAEQADVCRDDFMTAATPTTPPSPDLLTGAASRSNQKINGNSYYLNDEFNLAALKLDYPGVRCMTFVNFAPRFTVPTPVNVNDLVTVDGSESVVDLGPGTYSWNFGDGTPDVPAASAVHAYPYGGTYTITLTVTDQAGNVAAAQHQITVAGPSAPAPPSSGGSGSGSGGASGSGATPAPTSTAPGTSTPATVNGSTGASGKGGSGTSSPALAPKAPAATTQILSRSVRGARRSGVTVAYSVNQAVAGRFEIMVDAATAKRLRIKGAHVAGGPAGSGGSVVIGSAILATQKAGAARLAIRLNKSAASRLTRVRVLKITVKLTVANDAGQRSAVDAATQLH